MGYVHGQAAQRIKKVNDFRHSWRSPGPPARSTPSSTKVISRRRRRFAGRSVHRVRDGAARGQARAPCPLPCAQKSPPVKAGRGSVGSRGIRTSRQYLSCEDSSMPRARGGKPSGPALGGRIPASNLLSLCEIRHRCAPFP
jgi:hypothetical protein